MKKILYSSTILSLILLTNFTLNASILENRYSSANIHYSVLDGDVEGTAMSYGVTFQFTGGEGSGFAFLASDSSVSIDEYDGLDLSLGGLDLDLDQTILGLGYVIKNADWHIIPYFAQADSSYDLSGTLDASLSLDTDVIGIMLRTALTPKCALTINLSNADIEDGIASVTVNGVPYNVAVGGSESSVGIEFEYSMSDSLALEYGVSFADGVNTFNGGLSYNF